MDGSALSFLKVEWKVSDTGSAHWASSFYVLLYFDSSVKITEDFTKEFEVMFMQDLSFLDDLCASIMTQDFIYVYLFLI